MRTVEGSSIRLQLSPNKKCVGGELVRLASLAFSSGKHFLSVVTQVVTKHVSVCLWQPKFSIDHSVTSKVIWPV